MFSLYTRLVNKASESPSTSIEYHMANVLVGMLGELHALSIDKVAARCSVSKSTLSKFVRSLGYEDYRDFKLDAEEYWHKDSYSYQMLNQGSVNITDYLCSQGTESYLRELEADMRELTRSVDEGMLEGIARRIHDSRDIMAFGWGYGAAAAENFRLKFSFYRKPVFTSTIVQKQDERLAAATRDSMVIVFSNSGQFLNFREGQDTEVEPSPFKSCSAHIVLVTSNPLMLLDPRLEGIQLPQNPRVRNHPMLFQLVTELLAATYQRVYGFPEGLEEW